MCAIADSSDRACMCFVAIWPQNNYTKMQVYTFVSIHSCTCVFVALEHHTDHKISAGTAPVPPKWKLYSL